MEFVKVTRDNKAIRVSVVSGQVEIESEDSLNLLQNPRDVDIPAEDTCECIISPDSISCDSGGILYKLTGEFRYANIHRQYTIDFWVGGQHFTTDVSSLFLLNQASSVSYGSREYGLVHQSSSSYGPHGTGSSESSTNLVVYNGKLYGGSIPRAEVCRYDGRPQWTSLKRFCLA